MMEIEDPNEHLRETAAKCEIFYGYFVEITKKWLTGLTLLNPVLSVLRCQIQYGRIDTANLIHPFTLRWLLFLNVIESLRTDCSFHSLPWNQDTLLGYAGEMLVGLLYVLIFWMIGCQMLILFIAICYYQFTFYEMFVHFVDHLKQSKKIDRKANAILKIVKFHRDIKRYDVTRHYF